MKRGLSFPIELAFSRSDMVMTVCEMNHLSKAVGKSVTRDIKRNCSSLKLPRGFTLEKPLIIVHGVEPALAQTGYFHHVLTLKDFFKRD